MPIRNSYFDHTVPRECPRCGSRKDWIDVDHHNKGFSLGKAAVGGMLLGPVGLLGGALGRKTVTYSCGKCGYTNNYHPK